MWFIARIQTCFLSRFLIHSLLSLSLSTRRIASRKRALADKKELEWEKCERGWVYERD
jgi:hypothetical protein